MNYQQWVSSLARPLAEMLEKMGGYLPQVLGAALLLALGWAAASLVRRSVGRLISRMERSIRARRAGPEALPSEKEPWASTVVTALAFWVILLFFVAAATEVLGFAVVSEALTRLVGYLPSVLAAAVIVAVALVAGRLAEAGVVRAAASAGLPYGALLARSAKITILVVAAVMALDQMGIESTLLIVVTALVVGAVLGGAALAFGLGARTEVANIVAAYYLLQLYRVGQKVKVMDVTGTIAEFRPTGVFMDTHDGRVWVPARHFSESTSALLTKEG